MEEKTMGQKLCEELSYNKKNVFEASDAATNAKIYEYAEGYKAFIDAAKSARPFARALRWLRPQASPHTVWAIL